MGVDATSEITIGAPVDAVAGYAADWANAPSWYARIQSVRLHTPPPLAVGDRATFVARFLGRRLEYTYEIAELEPSARLVMRTADGPFPMETTYTWAPSGPGSTHMTLRNRGQPDGVMALAAPLVTAMVGRANRGDLRRLKDLLERRGQET